jgi:hypothetical protein
MAMPQQAFIQQIFYDERTRAQLDALKRAWRTDGNPEHLRAFRELQASLAGPFRPPATVGDTPR